MQGTSPLAISLASAELARSASCSLMISNATVLYASNVPFIVLSVSSLFPCSSMFPVGNISQYRIGFKHKNGRQKKPTDIHYRQCRIGSKRYHMIHLSWIPEYTKPGPPGGQSFHVHNRFIYLPQTDTINKKTPRLNITAFDNSRFKGSSQHFYFKLCYTKLWLNCAIRKGQQQSGGMTDMGRA